MSGPLLALTVRQPHAWAILHAGKNVENRVWAPPHAVLCALPQRVAVHAAAAWDLSDWLLDDVPLDAPTGALLGTVELVSVHSAWSNRKGRCCLSTWGDFGPRVWHWRLDAPLLLPEPFPASGRLGLWNVQRRCGAAVADALRGLSQPDGMIAQ